MMGWFSFRNTAHGKGVGTRQSLRSFKLPTKCSYLSDFSLFECHQTKKQVAQRGCIVYISEDIKNLIDCDSGQPVPAVHDWAVGGIRWFGEGLSSLHYTVIDFVILINSFFWRKENLYFCHALSLSKEWDWSF